MYRIFILAVVYSIISVFLKSNIKEYDLIFKLGGGAIILLLIINEASTHIKYLIDDLNFFSEQSQIIQSLVKCAAITIATKLCADICKESGNLFLESIVELGGRIMLFVIIVPYITKIFEIAFSFAG